jgi:hypothetical protein
MANTTKQINSITINPSGGTNIVEACRQALKMRALFDALEVRDWGISVCHVKMIFNMSLLEAKSDDTLDTLLKRFS